jgi:hypothetical protein
VLTINYKGCRLPTYDHTSKPEDDDIAALLGVDRPLSLFCPRLIALVKNTASRSNLPSGPLKKCRNVMRLYASRGGAR